ncbi:hypothetical protein C0580_03270, partial [Candidatus Parcubacteria bacterium]
MDWLDKVFVFCINSSDDFTPIRREVEMFVNARQVPGLVACRPLAWSHSDVDDDDRFQVLSQADFIRDRMSDYARQE